MKYRNKYLLENRSDSNRWGFIGGKMENNENAIDAIKREIKEETNLEVNELNMVTILTDPTRIIEYPNGNVNRIVSIIFECEISDFEELKCSKESEELKFLNLEEIKQIEIAETHLPILTLLDVMER